ncbi:hypothetical protein AB0F17_52335 [Nonomuraea sp. NPDC026600]|uniref:hypothetical protein n=1 Tax=Nonomuraea sp. NPDC026600 TaxID=3155363 RepID=UPI00340E1331
MTITLRPGSTVVFTGDSITDCQRLRSENGLGFGYPLRVAGEWGLRQPDRPVTLAELGTELILIEPFLPPIHGVVQAGVARALIGDEERKEWRAAEQARRLINEDC